MKHLKVEGFGPIKEVDLELRDVICLLANNR